MRFRAIRDASLVDYRTGKQLFENVQSLRIQWVRVQVAQLTTLEVQHSGKHIVR